MNQERLKLRAINIQSNY